jgi:hypothetical protein
VNGVLILTIPDGRRDAIKAGEFYSESKSYWGHINFWSPESWDLFVIRNREDLDSMTGALSERNLYAVLRRKPKNVSVL